MIVEGMYPGARTIGRANRFSAISPIKNAFSGVIQADLSFTLFLRYVMDADIPVVIWVSIEVIIAI